MTRAQDRVYCDGFGCGESYPKVHEDEGKPGFQSGKWLNWVYLDINRPDLAAAPLKFCDLYCLDGWMRSQPSYMRMPLVTDRSAYDVPSAPVDVLRQRRSRK